MAAYHKQRMIGSHPLSRHTVVTLHQKKQKGGIMYLKVEKNGHFPVTVHENALLQPLSYTLEWLCVCLVCAMTCRCPWLCSNLSLGTPMDVDD